MVPVIVRVLTWLAGQIGQRAPAPALFGDVGGARALQAGSQFCGDGAEGLDRFGHLGGAGQPGQGEQEKKGAAHRSKVTTRRL